MYRPCRAWARIVKAKQSGRHPGPRRDEFCSGPYGCWGGRIAAQGVPPNLVSFALAASDGRVEARMGDGDLMRASDDDRQQVVDRLRVAFEAGRLRMEEFTERVGLAYQAVTYGDLVKLHADLPAASPEAAPAAATRASPASQAVAAKRSFFADLPAPLKALWTIWLVAVSVNVVVWVLVVGTSGHFVYPWPVWVAGPYGAVLLGISAPVVHVRRSRPRPVRLPSPGEADSRRELGS